MDIADTIHFRVVCDIMTKIQTVKGTNNKINVISQYYQSFCNHRLRLRKHGDINEQDPESGVNSFYCVLRCLIPRCDKARPPYRLQIAALGATYIKILQLGEQSYDAEILTARKTNWSTGDYANHVYKVLKPRCQKEISKITIKKVHNLLDEISNGDHTDTEKVLTFLSENCSAYEQMWFIRLVLKSMYLGISDQQILNALHPHAKDFLLSCDNLAKLCCKLADNNLDIESKTSNDENPLQQEQPQVYLTPFEHVTPQLCEKFPGQLDSLMAEDVLYMETKMDGERFHLHFYKERFKYLSRNGCDYTESFGASFNEKHSLSSKLKSLLPSDIESIILDGEMMIWDIKHKTYHDKSENTDVKHLMPGGSWRPCFVVYDLLYFNGHHMIQLPYIQRMQKMRSLLKEEEGILHIMKIEKIVSVQHFQGLLQKSLNDHQEGVVLKKRNAIYRPGVRSGSGWYKVKADYFDGLTTEFDLLVMGGFYNRQRTFIESFLLGVLDNKEGKQMEVWSVGKVNNITRQRVILNNMLKPHWHSMVDEPPPSMWYHYVSNSAEGRPDVWIEPNRSIILQIKATDLNPSPAFALKTGLHFPRIIYWRNDKLWQECLSLEEYYDILNQSSGGTVKKIVKRNVTVAELRDNNVKRKKLTPVQKRHLALASYENKFNESNVEKSTNYLKDFKVCILSAQPQSGHTLEYLKTLVVENGGELVENPLPNNPKCITIAGENTFRVQCICKSGRYDVASVDWLLRYCKNPIIKIRPTDMLALTPELRNFLAKSYDSYGDHYTKFTNIAELREVMNKIPEKELTVDLNNSLIKEVERKIYGPNGSPYFYRNKIAHFFNFNWKMWKAMQYFCCRGGKAIDKLISNNSKAPFKVDYVFIQPGKFDRVKFKKWIMDFTFPFSSHHIVNMQWILDCHSRNRILNIDTYILDDL